MQSSAASLHRSPWRGCTFPRIGTILGKYQQCKYLELCVIRSPANNVEVKQICLSTERLSNTQKRFFSAAPCFSSPSSRGNNAARRRAPDQHSPSTANRCTERMKCDKNIKMLLKMLNEAPSGLSQDAEAERRNAECEKRKAKSEKTNNLEQEIRSLFGRTCHARTEQCYARNAMSFRTSDNA